jgi:hypothetical protein
VVEKTLGYEPRPAKTGRWSEAALRVLRERYLIREHGEVVETPEEMCWRVARAIAEAEGRFGRTPRRPARDRDGVLRDHGGWVLSPELAHRS